MHSNNLIVKPRRDIGMEKTTDTITTTLRTERGLQPSQPSNFAIVTQKKLLTVYNQLFNTFFIISITLSSIKLLMNSVNMIAIMMISVTERTREINIRKTLGTTRGTIL